MRHRSSLFVSLSLFAILATTPIFAIDARAAMKLCDKNPSCNYTVHDSGSVSIDVSGSMVDCPQKGECWCTFCPNSTPGRNVSVNPQILSRIVARPLPAPSK